MSTFIASFRVVIASMAICVVGYAALMLGIAQLVTPATANGSLITDSRGRIVGSALIAQKFSEARYFWPRPSAVDYNAAGAGGSNKTPTSPDLAVRAAGAVAQYGATATHRLPADLAAASGAGLDPHISLAGARYQAPRVAAARGLPVAEVRDLVERSAFSPGGPLTTSRIVNVLLLNRALDMMDQTSRK